MLPDGLALGPNRPYHDAPTGRMSEVRMSERKVLARIVLDDPSSSPAPAEPVDSLEGAEM